VPKKELARDNRPGVRLQLVIDQLRGGVPPVDPVRASWDEGELVGPTWAYRNYHLGRTEYAQGRIPKDLLWMYTDERYGEKG
jgi:hypothetical protein